VLSGTEPDREETGVTQTVVVAGATGYLGRHLVVELAGRGYRVRAVVRSRSRAEQPGPHGAPGLAGHVAEWVQAEVTAPRAIAGACVGAQRVVSALGVTRQKASPWDVDFLANLHLLQDAERQGAQSFRYVNVMHADRGRSLLLRSKTAFATTLERSALAHQIVNPSGYFSDAAGFLGMARSGVAFLPPDPDIRLAPIHGADLAAFCVDRIGDRNGSWDVLGPDPLSYRQIAQVAFDALGKRPRTVVVPAAALRAMVWFAGRLGQRPADLAQFFADGLTLDADGKPYGTRHLADYFRALATHQEFR